VAVVILHVHKYEKKK